MSYLEKARAMRNMMAEGKTMEAFEKYYAENCTITEVPTGEVREGKEAQRQAIIGWYDSVEEAHGGGVKSLTSNEEAGTTCAEVWFDVTFKGQGRYRMEEVAVQEWEGDQIVTERFYYHMPGGGEQG